MMESATTPRRSTRKKDAAPRGIFRHSSGVWAARFTCGAGHIHEEKVGPVKGSETNAPEGSAVYVYRKRKQHATDEPGWCPKDERYQKRAEHKAKKDEAARRVSFRQYAEESYLPWAEVHQRSYRTTRVEVGWLVKGFGERRLDEITTADVERILARLQNGESPSGRVLSGAAVNRYRDRLSGLFKRAVRLGLAARNPVTGIPKHKEPGGRIVYLTAEEEAAVLEALPETVRPMFTVAINTGLRWSEQRRLLWADVDMLSGTLTVRLSKHGRIRQVPMNSQVRDVLLELAIRRHRPEDPKEAVFACPYREASKFFPQAVVRGQAILRASGRGPGRLEGFTWHGLRHTFASLEHGDAVLAPCARPPPGCRRASGPGGAQLGGEGPTELGLNLDSGANEKECREANAI